MESKENLQLKVTERHITLFDHSDKELVVMTTRYLAAEAGFGETQQFLIAAAASELATNIVKYAKKGEVTLKIVQRDRQLGIQIIARDEGPGIADIEKAMQDNFSTSKGSLGLGLPSVRRIMDEFKIESQPGYGTIVSSTEVAVICQILITTWSSGPSRKEKLIAAIPELSKSLTVNVFLRLLMCWDTAVKLTLLLLAHRSILSKIIVKN